MIMRIISLLLLIGFVLTSYASPLYKRVEKDGTVTYSDTPVEGAEEISLPPLTTMPPPVTPVAAEEPETVKAGPPYRAFSIISPENDATIRSNEGNVTISLTIDPPLRADEGDRIALHMDGAVMINGSTGLTMSLQNVDRGTHRLHAEVRDSSGRVLAKTSPVTIHVKRHSMLHNKSN